MDEEFNSHVSNDNWRAVTKLFESETTTNAHYDYDRALIRSVECNDSNLILRLLESGADLHTQNDYVLRWSAARGHINIVTKLLELGANMNATMGADSNSALELSTQHNRVDMVTALLECGADVHINNERALLLSMSYRRYKIMAKLLEHGADIHCRNKRILKQLQEHFDEKIADIILPYCDFNDYEYFSPDYIRKRIVPTKNANTM